MNLSWDTKEGKLAIGGIIGAVAILIALGVVFFFPRQSDDAYRTIKVYRVEGTAEVDRPGVGVSAPYVDMMLQNDDRVATMADGWLYLLMDGSKYLLAEPETTFTLEASGTNDSNQTRLSLEAGSLVSHITEPLSDDSSYEVSTPNSVMAVRGTSLRVYVWRDEDGVSHTVLQVFEGTVKVRLVYPDGTLSEERAFTAGQAAYIWGNNVTSDYESTSDEIDYYDLETDTLEFLKVGIEGLDDYTLTVPDVDEIIRLKQTLFTVRFMVGGNIFGTQQVRFGQRAVEPVLRPTATGSWDFSFDTPIRQDTDVHWQE